MITDPGGRLAFANADLLSLGGWEWGQLAGRLWHEALVPAEHRRRAQRAFDRALRDGEEAGCIELPLRARDGRTRIVAWSACPSFDDSGHPAAVTSVGIDVTRWASERDRIAREKEFDASHDRATGLPNGSAFRWRLGAELPAARPSGRSTGVLLIGVERLRTVIETLGHEAGERLITEMAERVSDCVEVAVGSAEETADALKRSAAQRAWMVARWSDHEFAVLLPDLVFVEEAVYMARSIIAAISSPCSETGGDLRLSASIGIVVAPSDGDSAETLMRHAAMAERGARSTAERLLRFEMALSEEAEDRLLIEQQLPLALDRGEISVVFQPEVDAQSRRIVGLEALCRWHHPVLGEVPPGRFIPIAEDVGVIADIGRFVLRSALSQAAEWRREGLGRIRVAVNVSSRQLLDRSLVTTVLDCLGETDTPPNVLELEITESAAMVDSHAASEVLRALASRGVTISLDDFGTGYSNLGKLHHLAVSTIKIDRSFLLDEAGTETVPDPGALLCALVTLGRSLGLRVIAEGVETEEQLMRLEGHSLDAYQGFLFSRPVPPAEVHRLLCEDRPLGAGLGHHAA
ncbi:MAG TPA: EAL domain-containing protein [Candidatus Binatia bacterium]|nr:EAL domain-containing protein [Candidatus Binatia bacterium]